MDKALARLKRIDTEMHLLADTVALLGWDQETYMPTGGLESRSEQLALMEGLVHDRLVDPEVGPILEDLGCTDAQPMGDPALPEEERRYLRAFRRAWSRAAKLPGEFVREKARAVSRSQTAWAEARKKNDFPAFLPHLEGILGLAKREAAYLGPDRDPYSVLLDLYEPGMSRQDVAGVFARLAEGLTSLLGRIASRPQVQDSFLRAHCPAGAQEKYCRSLLPLIGFDQEGGRLDVSAHPFTTSVGRGDVRITTRFLEDYFPSSIFSVIHEGGHALYEMGLPEAWKRLCAGEAVSMAVHESQSRFWENMVGRSLAFWEANYPALRAALAPLLDAVPLEDFHRALNKVQSSAIRVDADEVTYSLHVILRFQLESALMSGDLEPAGLPAAWREGMRRLLGFDPPDDARGCLQDIHWSMGAIGYFPSYALGNLYAAQFARAMEAELGDLGSLIRAGDCASPLAWLRKKIHARGSLLSPSELVQDVTGKPLSAEAFLDYLEAKYAGIYGFSPARPGA
jgi:carboxypeptidase Taq